MTRNRLLLALVWAAMFVGLAHDAQGREPERHRECSFDTLKGEYMFTGAAEARLDQRDDPTYPRRSVGVWTFDGNGGMTGFNVQNNGGRIARAELTGAYVMDSERCLATLALGAVQRWEIVVARDGSEGIAVRVDVNEQDLGTIATRFLKKRD